MRRLGGGVDDQLDVGAVLGKQGLDPLAIPDVDLAMRVVRDLRFQVAAAPLRRRVVAEELLPHVVVDADDLETLRTEEADRLRADQTGRPGDDANLQEIFHIEELMIGIGRSTELSQ